MAVMSDHIRTAISHLEIAQELHNKAAAQDAVGYRDEAHYTMIGANFHASMATVHMLLARTPHGLEDNS